MTYVYLSPTISGEPFTVGFYDPAGKWQAESDHRTADLAAERVAFLNGGRPEGEWPAVHKIRLLRNTLREAARKFREYERLHLEKDTDEGPAKADINGDMAENCEDALEATK